MVRYEYALVRVQPKQWNSPDVVTVVLIPGEDPITVSRRGWVYINTLGRDGWELVAAYDTPRSPGIPEGTKYVLKRALER